MESSVTSHAADEHVTKPKVRRKRNRREKRDLDQQFDRLGHGPARTDKGKPKATAAQQKAKKKAKARVRKVKG